MKYIELNEFQSKTLIDAKQLYEALRLTRQESQGYQGSMHWKKVAGAEYLIKSVRGVQHGVGAKSAATEEIYRSFSAAKAAATDRLQGVLARLAEQARVCKAASINRVPSAPAKVLRMLDAHGLLGKNLTVIGTNAMYAYESAAGILFDSAILATTDIDLMLDARMKLKIAAKERVSEGGLMALLKRADASFTPVYEKGFRAVNRDGYFVDIVKAEPRPPWKDEPSNLGATDTLEAAPIKSLNWLLSAPKFSDIAIGWDGVPVPIVCPDPRAYALQKLWLSSQPDRDPLKKGRDQAQAFAVAAAVVKRMPQLPFLPGELLNFPKEIVGSGDSSELERLVRSLGIDNY